MKLNTKENLTLNLEASKRRPSLPRGKSSSLKRDFEDRTPDHQSLDLTVKAGFSGKRPAKLLEKGFYARIRGMLRQRLMKHLGTGKGILNHLCLLNYLRQLSRLSKLCFFFLDFFCFLFFFFFLEMGSERFFSSFYMVFEVTIIVLMVFGLTLRLVPRRPESLFHLLTFLIPLISNSFPRYLEEKANTYANLFRGLRILRVQRHLAEYWKGLLKKMEIQEKYENFSEIVFFHTLFIMLGTMFLMTLKITSNEEIDVFKAFKESEILIFECLNTMECRHRLMVRDNDKNERFLEVFIIIFLSLYYTCLAKLLLETRNCSQNHKNHRPKASLIKNPNQSLFAEFRKRQLISLVGVPPLKLIEKLFEGLFAKDRSKIYDLVIFLEKENSQRAKNLASTLFKQTCQQQILNFKVIDTDFMENPNFNEKLRILKRSEYVLGFLDQKDKHSITNFNRKLLSLQKILTPSQKILTFSSLQQIPKKKASFIPLEKLREFCLANIIRNPCIFSFFRSLAQSKAHFLALALLPTFFLNRGFQECSRIITFSSFYCKEVRNSTAAITDSIHTMVVVLGVLTPSSRFLLNPSPYFTSPGDRVLLMTNDRDSIPYIESYGDQQYRKYLQINDLVEGSFRNLEDEGDCSEADFLRNLNLQQKKLVFSGKLVDLVKNPPIQAFELDNHYVLFAFDLSKDFCARIARIINRISEHEPKASILVMANQRSPDFFEGLARLNCSSFYGDFFSLKHLSWIQVPHSKSCVILSSNDRDYDKSRVFLYKFLKETFAGVNVFLETEMPLPWDHAASEVFSDEAFYSLAIRYALNPEIMHFFDGLMKGPETDSENVICSLSLNDKLANTFKNFGNLFLFFFRLKHAIIPLGVCIQTLRDKKKPSLENEHREKFITNPELTLKLRKGNEILLLMKKESFLECDSSYLIHKAKIRKIPGSVAENDDANCVKTRIMLDYERLGGFYSTKYRPANEKRIRLKDHLIKAISFHIRVLGSLPVSAPKITPLP